jgi:hypothetical protein
VPCRDIIGTDERLTDNIHALQYFKRNEVEYLALAQPDEHRVLIVEASDGTVVSELVAPTVGVFTKGPDHGDVNDYWNDPDIPSAFAPTGKNTFLRRIIIASNVHCVSCDAES